MSERSVSMESTSSGSGSCSEERSPRSIFKTSKEETKTASYVAAGSRKVMKVNKGHHDQQVKISKIWKSSFQTYSQNLRQKIKQMQMGSVQEQIQAMREIGILMEQVCVLLCKLIFS